MRAFTIVSFGLFAIIPLLAQSSGASDRSEDRATPKASSAQAQQAQSPKEFLESRLGGKVVKLEKDPSDPRRAILSVERNGAVTQHVLEADLNAEREPQDVRIVTTEGRSKGIPPVIVMPLSVASKCWSKCKERCGEAAECRFGYLFECFAS
jgi:hypothetical protein